MSQEDAAIAAHFLAQLANMPDDAHFGPPEDVADVAEVVQLNDEIDAERNAEMQEEVPEEPPADDDASEDDWVYGENKKHQSYMVNFMRFKDGVHYAKDTYFTKEQLLAIRPVHVRRWLNQLAYHKTAPTPDDKPVHYRSGSLKKAKGGISFFHPNKHVPWVDPHGGNPTQHRSINELIQKVAKAEVRGIGKKANDKRAYTREEFQKKIELFRKQQDFNHHSKYVMITLWCKHLILRIDDACNFKMDAPKGSVEYPFAIATRAKWSKNVVSFANCPDQIMFGSKRWQDCVQLHLAAYLEGWIHRNTDDVVYLFCESTTETAPSNTKQVYTNRCTKVIWNSREFKSMYDQVGDADDRKGLGTHSNRKYASTEAKRRGGDIDQVEYRGRWIGERKRGSVCATRYVDVDAPFDDAFIASLLCDEGPIAYELKDGYEVADEWLFEHVVPNIRSRYNNDHRLCRVLALSLLWGSFESECRVAMKLGLSIFNRFVDDYLDSVPGEDFNPVQKVPLHIMNNNGRLQIVKIRETPSTQQQQQATTPEQINRSSTEERAQQQAVVPEQNAFGMSPVGAVQHNAQLMIMMSNLEQQIQEKFDVQNMQIASLQNMMMEQMQTVNNNIRRYGGTITSAFANQARQSGERVPQVEPQNLLGAFGAMDRRATLTSRPRDLMQLWEEWTVGIGDRKAAKDFTTAERNNKVGGTKQRFYRRLLVWKTQARLIDGGMSLIAANNRITSITGASTVTGVITKLIAFKKMYAADGGIHPQLKNG
jgi:hypothetical protein